MTIQGLYQGLDNLPETRDQVNHRAGTQQKCALPIAQSHTETALCHSGLLHQGLSAFHHPAIITLL